MSPVDLYLVELFRCNELRMNYIPARATVLHISMQLAITFTTKPIASKYTYFQKIGLNAIANIATAQAM